MEKKSLVFLLIIVFLISSCSEEPIVREKPIEKEVIREELKKIEEIRKEDELRKQEEIKKEELIQEERQIEQPLCQDECSFKGLQQCLGADLKICDHYDADPCLDWSPLVPCPPDQPCQSGFCTVQPEPALPIEKEISLCQEITESGNYLLYRDISGTDTCLNIHDTQNIHINCNNHIITGVPPTHKPIIEINNVKNFSLISCKVVRTPSNFLMTIKNSKDGLFSQNIFQKDNAIILENTSNIKIINNILHSSLQQAHSKNNLIENNTFDILQGTNLFMRDAIVSKMGSNNIIRKNKINGRSDGVFQNMLGLDNGMAIQDETGNIIEENFIENVFCTGIETAGVILQTKIRNNIIKNTGNCGIGGWYWNSWKENTIENNEVYDSPRIFAFHRVYGLRTTENEVYFQDNIFIDNAFINPKPTSSFAPESMYIDILSQVGRPPDSPNERTIQPDDMITGNNFFRNNDFTKISPAPVFNPKEMIVDGGGNICSTPTETNYSLVCN
jgi:hypothetical protein